MGTRQLLRSPWPSGKNGSKMAYFLHSARTAQAQRTVHPLYHKHSAAQVYSETTEPDYFGGEGADATWQSLMVLKIALAIDGESCPVQLLSHGALW